jgi:hypothetical protein
MTAQTILPANSASGGFNVANSVRLDTNAYLHKTPSGSGNRKTWTASVWVKGQPTTTTNNIAGQAVFSAGDSATDRTHFYFTNGIFEFRTEISNTQQIITTNQVFTDPAAWYHIVVAVDSTQSTDTNRVKIYANGVQITSFSAAAYLAEDADTYVNHTVKQYVGSSSWSVGSYFNGYMAEFVLLDGTAATPTSFGEFDEDSNIWKPIKVSDLTFGTNGFYLDFQASGNLGNDANGGTDLTEVNIAAVDQTTDTCTNNFATLNPLFPEANVAYTQGNTVATADGSANWSSTIPTVGLVSGKWYWEWTATSTNNVFVGIASEVLVNSTLISDDTPYDQNGLILYFAGRRKTVDGTDTETHFTAFGSGTMSAALDLDSGTRTITFYHNGSATGDVVNLTANFAAAGDVFPVFMVNAGSNPSIINVNFGNPSYANSSSAADGDGFGNFEFAPPSGYFAICTKNLAEYG